MLNMSGERVFVIGMWFRIAYGFLRILLGLSVLKVVGMPLVDVLTSIMSYELAEDHNDILYRFLFNILYNHPVYISYFLATYLIFWGFVDMFLSYNLLKHRLWAFPVSLVVIGLFVIYEIVRFTNTHSLILLSVILIDTLILFIIWNEYRKLKKRQIVALEQ